MRSLSLFLTWLGLLLPVRAFAYTLPSGWLGNACDVIPCHALGAPGVAGLAMYLEDRVLGAMQVLFVAVAVVMLFIASLNIIFQHGDENAVKEARSAFYYTIIGGAIVAFTVVIRAAFRPEAGIGQYQTGLLDNSIMTMVTLIKALMATALIANIVLQGMRLIASRGVEEHVTKARKRLVNGFVGVGLILLTNSIVAAATPGSNAGIIAAEIVGLANFLIVFTVMLAVIAIILAGVMLVISVDESMKEKAKTAVRTAVVALIAMFASYALVNAFLAIV